MTGPQLVTVTLGTSKHYAPTDAPTLCGIPAESVDVAQFRHSAATCGKCIRSRQTLNREGKG